MVPASRGTLNFPRCKLGAKKTSTKKHCIIKILMVPFSKASRELKGLGAGIEVRPAVPVSTF